MTNNFIKYFKDQFRKYRGEIDPGYKKDPDYYYDYKNLIDWEICYVDDINSPNFWFNDLNALNNATIEICFDQAKFDEFVELCAEKIKVFLAFEFKPKK